MANKNLRKLQELSAKYNVPFQPLYTAKALQSGNLEVVHNIMLRGEKITCLQQYTHEDLEKLFKGESSNVKQENTVIFEKKDNKVSINGSRYTIFEVIKDMEMWQIYDILDKYIAHGEDWQYEMAQKIKNYIKNGGFVEWLEYQYEKEYGETVDEYEERMACVGVEV